jgi:hypothetical protein
MSGLVKKPRNTGLLQPTKYLLNFPEISDSVYFCQSVNLPGVNNNALLHVTPNLDLFVPGTKMQYNEFKIDFLVNEDLSSWLIIHDWIRATTTDRKDRTKTNGEAILTILSNLNNPKFRIKFTSIFPLTLSDIPFDSTQSAENHVVASATFKFDYFDIERL